MQVSVNQVEHARELYLRGEKSDKRQTVRLYLDSKTGALWCAADGDANSVIHDNVEYVRYWVIPCLTAEGANHLMREIAPYAQILVDATKAIEMFADEDLLLVVDLVSEKIDCACLGMKDCPDWLIEEWDAADFFAPVVCDLKITAGMTDKELEIKAEELEIEFTVNEATGNTMALWGTLEFLKNLRDSAREAGE